MSGTRSSRPSKRGGDQPPQHGSEPDRGGRERSLIRFLPILVLALLTGVYFWNLITPLQSQRAWLWEDFLFQNYPYRFFAATSLARGIFPFWNPYVFGGMPFLADIQTAVLYPFNLIQVLFAGPDRLSPYVVQAFEVLHYFIAAYLTWRYLRWQRLSGESALIGAVTFAFSGFMVTHALHMNFLSVFAWLPLVLETLERTLDSGKLRYAVACALVLALSTMGGYPQYTLYICYIMGLDWLVREVERKGEDGFRLRGAATRFLILIAVVGVGVGLNAYNWLPSAELARYTPRSEMTWDASAEHSFQPVFLLKLLIPDFFGVQFPKSNTYWAAGYSSFWETCLFVGVLPLSLAIFSLGAVARDRRVRWAAALGGVSLWLALGRYGFLYRLFFEIAPGIDRFRIPGRFAALVSFALALLAATGWERLSLKSMNAGDKPIRGPVFAGLGVTAAVLAVLALMQSGLFDGLAGGLFARPEIKSASRASTIHALGWCAAAAILLAVSVRLRGAALKAAGYCAAAFIFLELLVFGRPFLQGDLSPKRLYAETPLVVQLKKELREEIFRVNARSLENPGIMALRRNQGSIDRIFLLEGYNPLQLKRRLGEVSVDRRFDLLNVKYKIHLDQAAGSVSMVRHPTALPRAFLVHRWRVLASDEAILRTLNDPEFDHHNEVVLERSPGIDSPERAEHIESNVGILEYGQNGIRIGVETAEPGILVLSEWDYPAWKARIDGEPVEILRADYALRAVAINPGKHTVSFSYSSDTFRLGLMISLGLAISLAVFALAMSRKSRLW